ncbi:MAG: flagellar biosynthesis protein FliQ [Spirochaetales bacterium]|nr:flagellar biosynthesis protein FliQ [Spirochaetales bacterium]
MSLGEAVDLIRSGILQVVILATPVLLVAMVVGLVVSILQATTSIQEQTLTFVPKIAAILLMIALLGGWMFASLGQYTRDLFQMIPNLAR